MKVNRNINIAVGLIVLAVVIFNFISCDSFIISDEREDAKISEIHDKIATDQDEAKLLVLASMETLDIIAVCNHIEEENTVHPQVKNLVELLKDEQIEILKKYNDVASENIISIPDFSEIEVEKDWTGQSNADETVAQIDFLKTKIHHQIELLDELGNTTNNIEFIELAKVASTTLEENLILTKRTLKLLQSDS